MSQRQITIDDEVFTEIAAKARPFEDQAPNDVLRRLLGLDQGGPVAQFASTPIAGSPRREKALPLSEYELPLLRCLLEHDGQAPARETIKAVGTALGDKITKHDRELLKSGKIRWENRVQFSRLRLVEREEISRDSPIGLWEITEKGATRVRKAAV
jgi:negative regulator of replication initiation